MANFDPEFTEANLLEEAPDDVTFDEDDPSADWLDQATRRPGGTTSGPVAIKPRRPPASVVPLTNSVQENFRTCSAYRCGSADRRQVDSPLAATARA